MRDNYVSFINENIDQKYLIDTLMRLLQVPTQVPLGEKTLIEPDHPKLKHFVQNVIRPEFQELGVNHIIEAPLNQLVARMGSGESDQTLLAMAYTPVQHYNLMRDPFAARIAIPREHGIEEPCAFGQGASQSKAHFAAMLTILKMLVEKNIRLQGTLYFGVNNEGRSSHDCSMAILSVLDPKPQFAIELIGTDLGISLGNRGRVDIYVHVKGKATHSSSPDAGLNAIDGANEVINRLKTMTFTKTHPLLGKQHALAYQVVYWPIAPHTLPETAKLTIDRRLLPGDDIDNAVKEVHEALDDMEPFEIRVEKGVHMLPALVEPDAGVVQALQRASKAITGAIPKSFHGQGAFDAGGLCNAGVPAVMYGASGGSGLLGDDFVALSDVVNETKIMAYVVFDMLGAVFDR